MTQILLWVFYVPTKTCRVPTKSPSQTARDWIQAACWKISFTCSMKSDSKLHQPCGDTTMTSINMPSVKLAIFVVVLNFLSIVCHYCGRQQRAGSLSWWWRYRKGLWKHEDLTSILNRVHANAHKLCLKRCLWRSNNTSSGWHLLWLCMRYIYEISNSPDNLFNLITEYLFVSRPPSLTVLAQPQLRWLLNGCQCWL